MDRVRSGRHIVCRWIADKAYVVSITLRSFDLLLGSNTPEQKKYFASFPQANRVRRVPISSLEDTVATVTTPERQRPLP